MAFANAMRQLGRDLRTQKLRTILTTLGLVWGTVAVSLLLAFGEGLHYQMVKNSRGLGNGIVIAWPSRTSIPWQGLGRGRRIRLNEDDIRLVRQRSRELGQISSEYATQLRLQLGPKTLAVDVSGVHPEYAEMRNVIPARGGRFLNPLDMDQRRRVAFLGDDLANQLFGQSDPVGQEFRLNGSPFTVIGVMQRKIQQSSYSGRDKDKIFVPATTMQVLSGRKYMNNFVFTAADVTRTRQTTDEILAILAAKHRFSPQDKEALATWDTSEMAAFFAVFMLAFKSFLGVVGSLTLVVGGIGVSNIMNVVVEERTREIGIKMALGAKSRSVLGQFLVETLVLTAIGGVIGLSISYAICRAFPALGFTDFVGDPQFSLPVAALTAGLLGLIGLIAGYFPARTASRLEPVVAMKV